MDDNYVYTPEACLRFAQGFERSAYRHYAKGFEYAGNYAATQADRFYKAAKAGRGFQYVSLVKDEWKGWNSKL